MEHAIAEAEAAAPAAPKSKWHNLMHRESVESGDCAVKVWASVSEHDTDRPTCVLQVDVHAKNTFGCSMGMDMTPDKLRELAKKLFKVAQHYESLQCAMDFERKQVRVEAGALPC